MVNLSQKASRNVHFLGLQTSFHLSRIPSVCLAVPPPLLSSPCDLSHQDLLNEHFHKVFVCISNKTKALKPTGKKKKANFAFPVPPCFSHLKRSLNMSKGKTLKPSPHASNGNRFPWMLATPHPLLVCFLVLVWCDEFVRCCPLMADQWENHETCPGNLPSLFPRRE